MPGYTYPTHPFATVPIETFRAAGLMDFENSKIAKIELFYDARAFEGKKGDIFSSAAD